jgi:hypothetical protein
MMHVVSTHRQWRGLLRMAFTVAFGLMANVAGHGSQALAAINAWTSSGPPGAPVTALAVDVFGRVYAGMANHGVYMSPDNGVSWYAMNIGLGNTYVQSLLVDPSEPQRLSTLYAASPDRGVFKSVDAGQIWLPASNGLPGRSAQHLAFDSASATLFVSTGDGVFRSTDRGESWTATALRTHDDDPTGVPDISLGAWIDCLTVDPRTSALYACFFNWNSGAGLDWKLLRSCDAGETWQTVPLPGAGGPLAMTVTGGTNLYVVLYDPYASASTVVESCDSGATWHASPVTLDDCAVDCRINALALDASQVGAAYAATDRGVYRRDDDGAGWRLLYTGMGDRVATDVVAHGRFVYAATADGVFAMERGSTCAGDCNSDGSVDIGDLVTLVDIGMDRTAIEQCAAGDVDGDGAIHIADLVAAVGRAMHGCAAR